MAPEQEQKPQPALDEHPPQDVLQSPGAPGIGERLAEIHARADALVRQAEAEVSALDLCAPEDWPQVLAILRRTAEALAEAGFHDGALGPGTAMLDPQPFIDRVRTAYRFEISSHALPEDLTERLRAAALLARSTGLAEIVARVPNRWAESRAADAVQDLIGRVEQTTPSSLEMEILVGLDPDVDKWVGAATPKMRAQTQTMSVDGPPALHHLVVQTLSTGISEMMGLWGLDDGSLWDIGNDGRISLKERRED